jgi:hypothetical protein
VCAGDERAVVVKAGVASAFVVVESEFAFELAVVELDRPAQPGKPGEPFVRRPRRVTPPSSSGYFESANRSARPS